MSDLVLASGPLGTPPWPTIDPFLFCVHHDDNYPEGTEAMGPNASLSGRNIGSDFGRKDGWSMYHGDVIPGFPRHPHRGFETVTLARNGYIDHSDSLGATARFGNGDAQWMTAGKGVVHSEMFPLVKREDRNPTELFQLWMNLPAKDKMVEPYFTMLWGEKIPRHQVQDRSGRVTELVTVAGAYDGVMPPAPPPNSWAARPEAHVAIWTLKLEAGATFTIPPAAAADAGRVIYVFRGGGVQVGGKTLDAPMIAQLRPDLPAPLVNGDRETEILMLQGRPIGEPVAHHGPFVMNTRAELQQAFEDYRRTGFGGWPWPADGPAHSREEGRFAIHADGRKERPV